MSYEGHHQTAGARIAVAGSFSLADLSKAVIEVLQEVRRRVEITKVTFVTPRNVKLKKLLR